MFAKFCIFFVLITTALAASISARNDDRILVDVPKKGSLDTLKKLCKAWEKECKEIVKDHEPKKYPPGYVCEPGYTGNTNQSLVLCYAQTSSTTDILFTDKVIKKLGLKTAD